MLNKKIEALGIHPFIKTSALLSGREPNPSLSTIDLTIGEPQFGPPNVIASSIAESERFWGRYPTNNGPSQFREAVGKWLQRRFELPDHSIDWESEILPFAGAREALFQIGFLADSSNPIKKSFAMPTPHYAPYRAAAIMAGLEPLYIPVTPETSFLPDLDFVDQCGDRLALFIVCSPSNPEGSIASEAYLRRAIQLARKHNFILVVDECYSEIYFDTAPTGVLKVCCEMDDGAVTSFKNVIAINSLSKRSSAAGLRAAFACGDRNVMKTFEKLRAYCGGTAPVPNLLAASTLLNDESHVADLRALYSDNVKIIDSFLAGVDGYTKPMAGMFLWLRFGADEQAAIRAWEEVSLKIIPGSFLGPVGWNGEHPANRYCRIALVHPADVMHEVGRRLKMLLTQNTKSNLSFKELSL